MFDLSVWGEEHESAPPFFYQAPSKGELLTLVLSSPLKVGKEYPEGC